MAEFDIVIHGGRLIDGTGNPWFYGNVAIKNGHIAEIGKFDPKLGKRVIDAAISAQTRVTVRRNCRTMPLYRLLFLSFTYFQFSVPVVVGA